MVDGDGQSVLVGEPELVEEDLGLRAGVVENQRRLVLAHLLQDRGDRIGGTAAGPRRGLLGAQHLDVGGGAGIGQEHFAGVGVAGHQVGDG